MSSSSSTADRNADDLREVFQGLPRKPVPGETCPAPETLWASARGELAPAENRALIDHTGRCPGCAEDWRLARSVARSLDRRAPADDSASATERPRRGLVPRWVAAAAAVLLAAAGVGVFLWQTTDREPVYRDEPRAAIVSQVPEGEPLSRTDPTLRWSGPEGATYALVVTTERLEVLVREDGLTGTEHTLPEPVVDGLEPGTVLLWHVEATLPDGARVPSRTFRVQLE